MASNGWRELAVPWIHGCRPSLGVFGCAAGSWRISQTLSPKPLFSWFVEDFPNIESQTLVQLVCGGSDCSAQLARGGTLRVDLLSGCECPSSPSTDSWAVKEEEWNVDGAQLGAFLL
jgi:hypothetical protein